MLLFSIVTDCRLSSLIGSRSQLIHPIETLVHLDLRKYTKVVPIQAEIRPVKVKTQVPFT